MYITIYNKSEWEKCHKQIESDILADTESDVCCSCLWIGFLIISPTADAI
jgi:hypothetical protein